MHLLCSDSEMADNDSYDSDGGLEEISIGDSNKQLMEKWYSINKHLKTEKEKVKEKRRNHHLLCAEQKVLLCLINW